MNAWHRLFFALTSLLALTGFALPTDSPSEEEEPAEYEMPRSSILVLVPHPDDETLLAGGILARAKEEGKRVTVAVVTNGDFTCKLDGIRRESETVAALSHFGVEEDEIHFLGYPDGYLEDLGPEPLPLLERRSIDGRCEMGNTTYAARGATGTDVHTLFNGGPAVYTSDSLVGDMVDLLEAVEPEEVYVSHPIDEHPDHAFVYTYMRRALERANIAPPRVHRGLVHIGGCFPRAPGNAPCPDAQFAPREKLPPLPPLYEAYRASERVAVPEALLDEDRAKNPKYQAVAAYPSQTGPVVPYLSYLFAFARADEMFFPETLVPGDDGVLRRARAQGVAKGVVDARGPWLERAGRFERAVQQRAPMECRLSEITAGDELELLAGESGRYAIRSDGTGIVLRRVDARGESWEIRRWHLPRLPFDGIHHVTIGVDDRPDDGGVAEISVRYDGELLGVAVDPKPVLRGVGLVSHSISPDRIDCHAM